MENKQELDTYINGIPNINLIPKELADGIIAMLELEITEYYKNKDKDG